MSTESCSAASAAGAARALEPVHQESVQAHPRWTLAMSVMASSLAFVDGSVIGVALPAIRQSLDATAGETQWVVNASQLPLAALLLLGGALGDRYGRKRLLVIGTALFAAGSLLAFLSASLESLYAGRGIQGIGATLLLPNSLALLNGAFTGEARGRAIGAWAASGAVAAAGAPLLGGWLIDTVGWRFIFLIGLPLATAAVAISMTKVAEVRNESKARTDYAGAALAIVSLGLIAFALTLWSAGGRLSVSALATMVAGVSILAGFLWAERRRGESAMMPLSMFDNRCFSGLNFMTFLLYGAFGGILLLIPYVLIEGAGYSPFAAGLALLPLPILIAAGSPLMGGLAIRVGPRWPLTIGPIVVAGGMLLGLPIEPGSDYWPTIFLPVTVIALGMAIAVAPLTATILESVEARLTGTASGFNSAVSRAGILIATALLGAVLALPSEALFEGFHSAVIVGAAVALAAAGISWVSAPKSGERAKRGQP